MSSIPYLICWILLICSSFLADYIVTKKVLKILTVRKIFTTLSKILFIYFLFYTKIEILFKNNKRHALARHSTHSTYFHWLLKALHGRLSIDAWLFVQVNIYFYIHKCAFISIQALLFFAFFIKWLSWQWWFLCKFVWGRPDH